MTKQTLPYCSSMASTGTSSKASVGHANGETGCDETAVQSDEANEDNGQQQVKMDNGDSDLPATATTTCTATDTISTITVASKKSGSNKMMMTGDNNEVLIGRSTQVTTDKTQQRTSNNAVQDTKGIDNDKKPNISNTEWHRNELLIKHKHQQTRAQNSSNSYSTNNEIQLANQNSHSNNLLQGKNELTKQKRRNSSTSRTTSLDGSQQRITADSICSGTTTSKFREKRPEPLKLSSNLNQEIPLDLSVRR